MSFGETVVPLHINQKSEQRSQVEDWNHIEVCTERYVCGCNARTKRAKVDKYIAENQEWKMSFVIILKNCPAYKGQYHVRMEEDLLVSELTSKNRVGDKKVSVDQLPQCCIKRTTASKKRLDH